MILLQIIIQDIGIGTHVEAEGRSDQTPLNPQEEKRMNEIVNFLEQSAVAVNKSGEGVAFSQTQRFDNGKS
jgi:hypothetical protein